MDPKKVQILLGPPGTGKTTSLLNIVLQEMEKGVPPDRIGYFAFTRKATVEARTRAEKQFGLTADDLPYFRTLHSLAYRMLGLNRSQVFAGHHLRELAEMLSLESSSFMDSNHFSTIWGTCKGDRMFFLENLARVRRRPLKEEWANGMEDYSFEEVDRLSRSLKEYKTSRGIVDFTDMLEIWVREGKIPKLDVLVVDEAQDLSPIQWDMVDRLAQQAKRVYLAGDDDQAIFRWAGADVEKFIGLEGTERVLGHSYRCPQTVQAFAMGILDRIGHRRKKNWSARESEGSVNRVGSFDAIDVSEGEWLVLARNGYLLDPIQASVHRAGYLYEREGKSSAHGKELEAIVFWERLRKGREIDVADARKVYFYMTKKQVAHGCLSLPMFPEEGVPVNIDKLRKQGGLLTTDPWFDVLSKIAPINREYLRAVLQRGEPVLNGGKPRITLSTIHGAKGGEAQNVVMLTDMSFRTMTSGRSNPGDEERVFYVAATRAKENLHVIDATTSYNFALA